jgi:hypothetical protein
LSENGNKIIKNTSNKEETRKVKGGKIMDCENIKELLSTYIDEECTEEEMKIIENHLLTCKDCQREYKILKDIKDRLGQVLDIELPEGLHNDIMDSIKKEQIKPEKKKRSFYKWSLPIAAAFILVITFAVVGEENLFRLSSKMTEESGMSDGISDYSDAEMDMATTEMAPTADLFGEATPRDRVTSEYNSNENETDMAMLEFGDFDAATQEVASEEVYDGESYETTEGTILDESTLYIGGDAALDTENSSSQEINVADEISQKDSTTDTMEVDETESIDSEIAEELAVDRGEDGDITQYTARNGIEDNEEIIQGVADETMMINLDEDGEDSHQVLEIVFVILGMIIIIALLILIFLRLRKLKDLRK